MMSSGFSKTSNWQPSASWQQLKNRASMLKIIRQFFDDLDVMEVETPLLSHYAVTDLQLNSLPVQYQQEQCYLNTSPEYAMKRLLAKYKLPIYQISKAFREDIPGVYHNPEFTLLEWYRPNYNMLQLMDELQLLIERLFVKTNFQRLSYQQAFERQLGFNPHYVSGEDCFLLCQKQHLEIPLGLSRADDVDEWLDWLLVSQISPHFNEQCFTFLYDYPVSQCALAKIAENSAGIKVAKRFEIFHGELELANGFDELTDAKEQRKRFEKENNQRKRCKKSEILIDKNFISALNSGLPKCAGVAVGLDRLLLLQSNSSTIESVLSFSWERA